ncbi:MAG TPA: macro domain-containing protein [Gemmatimonadales bacterium]
MPRIEVRQGNITAYDGDAIVNAANNHLLLGAGVAGAIAAAGGPTIQQECDRLGPIAVGDAAITEAGNLTVRYVIHAAAMGDQPVSEASIRGATAAALRLGASHDVSRLAFPVLGAGIGGFAFARSAELMLDTIRTSAHADALEEIALYGFTAADAATLRRLVG